MRAKRKSIPSLVLWVVWLATRTDLYLHAAVPGRDGDAGLYQHWYACCFSQGTFPAADPRWQYPPGAALVFWLPGRLPGSYVEDFLVLALGCDLAITVMLYSRARRGGSLAGAWYWVCGVPLLGPVTVGRFDVVPVALSVAALCVAGRGGVRGALIGAGAAIKAWPLTLLAGMAPGQQRRGLAAAAAVLAGVCAIFASGTASFLAHASARGVEIESVAATPFMIWRQAGWPGTVVYRFGAYQLSGGHAALAQDASFLGLVLAAAAVTGWRLLIASGRASWRPEFAADAPLAATLLFLVASPVLSPQYLLWVTGLAAACLATGPTTQRPVALAVLAAAGLTQVIFPIKWLSLVSGSDAVTGVLAARNVLLVLAAALSCWRILRVTSPGHQDPGHQDPGKHRDSPRQISAGDAVMLPDRPELRHNETWPQCHSGWRIAPGRCTWSRRRNSAVTANADNEGRSKIDTTVPHSARIWNYWLGGKDNYPVDRQAGEQTIAVLPEIVDIARASRQFLVRVVRYLAGDAGIRQFLDIGTGLPTVNNTHQVAQKVAPESRVVYVDNDPLVLAHARALLTSSPEGATDYIEADARDVEEILKGAAATLDFTRPVAITMLGILPFIGDDNEAEGIVTRLLATVPAGSYLAVTHSTSEVSGERVIEAVRQWNQVAPTPYRLRSPAQIAGFFEGMELIEPGVVPCPRWRPEPHDIGNVRDMDEYCALGRT